jgi:hypothetical protein
VTAVTVRGIASKPGVMGAIKGNIGAVGPLMADGFVSPHNADQKKVLGVPPTREISTLFATVIPFDHFRLYIKIPY